MNDKEIYVQIYLEIRKSYFFTYIINGKNYKKILVLLCHLEIKIKLFNKRNTALEGINLYKQFIVFSK